MPYVRDGLCVYKQNPDGSKGKLEGCSATEQKAKGHLRALYAHMPETKEASIQYAVSSLVPDKVYRMRVSPEIKEAGTDISQYNAHGPGGILSKPGQGKRKKKKVSNAMLTPKEFTEAFEVSEKDFSYAQAETWVFSDAAQALSYLMSVARQEISMQEADDSKEIIAMMQDLITFMSDQLDEATSAINEPTSDSMSGYASAVFKEAKDKELGGYLVTEADGTKHLPTRVNGKLDPRHLAAARAALTSNYRGHAYAGPNKSEALSKLKKLYSEAGLDWAGKEATNSSTLINTKESDGRIRWTMITASAFEDKDQEIIATKAFERDCDEMELTGDYGELLWWHCDGTQHAKDKEARPYIPLGSCDLSLVYNKLNIESGLYYDNEVGQYFNQHSKEFGASKSFWHKEDEPLEGIYSFIRTKERSVLPRTKEANLLTRLFGGTKEKEMADNNERIAALKEKLGEDKTNELLAQAKAMSEKAEEFLASKEKKAKKPTDEEDKKDQGADEDTEDTKMKELQATLVAVKESNDAFALSLKEMKDSFEGLANTLKEQQTKELTEVKTNVAELQKGLAALYGVQPKGMTGRFEASKEGKVADLTPEQKRMTDKVKEAGAQTDSFMDMASWLVTGNRDNAA